MRNAMFYHDSVAYVTMCTQHPNLRHVLLLCPFSLTPLVLQRIPLTPKLLIHPQPVFLLPKDLNTMLKHFGIPVHHLYIDFEHSD